MAHAVEMINSEKEGGNSGGVGKMVTSVETSFAKSGRLVLLFIFGVYCVGF